MSKADTPKSKQTEKDLLKQKLLRYVEQHQSAFCAISDLLLKMPEFGYKEQKTSDFVFRFLSESGLTCSRGHGVTGVKTVLHGKKSLRRVALLGELDAVSCRLHPHADSATGAAHACGHSYQTALLLCAAQALVETRVMQELDGDIALMAVPAEEFLDMEYRCSLVQEQKISYYGGKQQLIYEGAFDDIDMAMMLHAQPHNPQRSVFCRGGSLGFCAKTIEFFGQGAHASTPELGVNALQAANLALTAINANRDAFPPADRIKIHPILTHGGDIVNTVPDYASIETYVRAGTKEAIRAGAEIVDRCARAGACAMGAQHKIVSVAGYLPLVQNTMFSEVFENNATQFLSAENIHQDTDVVGSTDMGDLSHLMPCIHPTFGTFSGEAHDKNFLALDLPFLFRDVLCMTLFTLVDLLYDNAQSAVQITDAYAPLYSKQAYLAYLDSWK